MKSDRKNDIPSVQVSLNMRTDCGLSGDAKSIVTSAGWNNLPELFEFATFVARMSRNNAEIAISTIFCRARKQRS